MKYHLMMVFPQAFWGAVLLSGCAFSNTPPATPFVQTALAVAPCPRPEQVQTGKDMPAFIMPLPLCHADNMECLLMRDARLRQYIKALEATISCYERTLNPTIH